MGETADGGANLYRPYDGPIQLQVDINSPYLKTSDPAFAAILGYPVIVDLFKSAPSLSSLQTLRFKSPDYSVAIDPPYDGDTYGMAKAGGGFSESYRIFKLIYIPGKNEHPSSDQCFIDYYWHKLQGYDDVTDPAKSDVAGLPDLANSTFVIRVLTLPQGLGERTSLYPRNLADAHRGTRIDVDAAGFRKANPQKRSTCLSKVDAQRFRFSPAPF
jgi:hypothetical protein